MAYDANDPADVKIVTDAVNAALEAQREEHEAEIQGLKDKRDELLGKIRKLRTEGGGESTGEIERLENELSESNSKLRSAESQLRQMKRDLESANEAKTTAENALTKEREISTNELVNNHLTAALVEANVAPQFLEDVTASLSRQVVVKEVDGKRQTFVGDKPLGEFIKNDWSQGDKGKHYVVAPTNSGGGVTPPGSPQGGVKKISEMNTLERNAHFLAIGKEAFEKQFADEKAASKP